MSENAEASNTESIQTIVTETVNSMDISQLTKAVLENDIQKVTEWIAEGKTVNTKDDDGIYPLEQTLVMDNLEMATLLLEAGAEPLMMTESGKSIYQLAMESDSSRLKDVFESHVTVGAKTVNVQNGNLNITITPQMEVLNVLLQISGYDQGINSESKYMKEVKDFFSPYSNHTAVKMTKTLSEHGLSYDAPSQLALNLTFNKLMVMNINMQETLLERLNVSKPELQDYIHAINAFIKDSGFIEFYDKNTPLYKELVGNFSDSVLRNPVDILENYFGYEQNSYTMLISLLEHNCGYGPRVLKEDNRYDVYAVITSSDPKKYVFDYMGSEGLVLHEFSHSFINPLTKDNPDGVKATEHLFKGLEERMSAQAYPLWETVLNEHLVRAATNRMLYLNENEEASKNSKQWDLSKGFIYIDLLEEEFKSYEADRNSYNTFAEFYPHVIEVMSKTTKEQVLKDAPDFNGIINAVSQSIYTERCAVIIPAKSKFMDEEGKSLVKFFESRGIKCKLMKDDSLDEEYLKEAFIFNYAIAGKSPMLDKMDLPFEITKDSILVKGEVVAEGKNLEFIGAVPNPYNTKVGMVIYTSQTEDGLSNINSNYHGGASYQIFDKDETLITEGSW